LKNQLSSPSRKPVTTGPAVFGPDFSAVAVAAAAAPVIVISLAQSARKSIGRRLITAAPAGK